MQYLGEPSRRLIGSLIILIFLFASTVVSPVEGLRQEQRESPITWSRTYAPIVGTDTFSITSDQGFVVIGLSNGAWVMKANRVGNPEWEREYVASGYAVSQAQLRAVWQTSDRGYVLAGMALSLNYVSGFDAWLLKLDRKGNVQWSATYGGLQDDYFSSVRQTSDGGYIAVGNTQSFGSPYHASNGWVIRVDSEGRIVWQETFEGQDVYSVDQTHDGGFVLAGTVAVSGKADAWVFKLDSTGKVVWQKAYELAGNSGVNSILQTSDGGYMAAGGGLFFRLDSKGNILWEKSYSGGGSFSVHQTPDGGFIVSGRSNGPWLLKLDNTGKIDWQKIYGGQNDFLLEAQPTSQGGLIASGVLYATGSAWVLSMNGEGTIQGCSLGIPSNDTITNAASTVSDTALTGVWTSAVATLTGVSAHSPQFPIQTSCVGVSDKHKGPRE